MGERWTRSSHNYVLDVASLGHTPTPGTHTHTEPHTKNRRELDKCLLSGGLGPTLEGLGDGGWSTTQNCSSFGSHVSVTSWPGGFANLTPDRL